MLKRGAYNSSKRRISAMPSSHTNILSPSFFNMLFAVAGWTLLHVFVLPVARGSDIPITLYTDIDCVTPSTSATNVSLGIGVCVATLGLSSFHLGSFPCLSGSVSSYVFSDTACGSAGDSFYYYRGLNDCMSAYNGGLAAIMLSCNQEKADQPASFTTITVGPIATAATAASSAASGGNGDDSSSTSSGSSSPSKPEAHGWDSLSLGTKLGIIISLAVGVPPILIGLYTIRYYRKKQRQKRAESRATDLQSLVFEHPRSDPGFSGSPSGDSRNGSAHFHPNSGYHTDIRLHSGMGSWRQPPVLPGMRWNGFEYVIGSGRGA